MATTSLDKALRLLDIISQHGRAGITGLARASGYPAPTVHRLLGALVRNGYVSHDSETREYFLALKFLELGARVRNDISLASLAMPAMRELMELSGETVNLVMFEHQEAVYVEQIVNPRSMLLMFTRIGARAPLFCSGVGKAYLAAQDDAFLNDYCAVVERVPRTRRTIVEETALRQEILRIRRQGYAVDDEEMEYGVRCVAALIRRGRDIVLGGISISGPTARVTPEQLPHLGLQVRRAAEEISDGLSGRDINRHS